MNKSQMLNEYVSATRNCRDKTRVVGHGRMTPAYLPGTVGLKDIRLSASQKLHIRSKTRVGLSNGSADGAENNREYDSVIRGPRYIEGEFSPDRRKNYRPNGRGMLLY